MKLALIADRVGWEERELLAAASDRGIEARWIDDASLCLGSRASGIPEADVYLMRSRSYTRCVIIAGLLGDRGERVVNSPSAIEICQDKLVTARVLGRAGLPILDFRVVLSWPDLARAIDELGLPCVIKPLFGGLGRRVLLIRDRDLARAAYEYVEYFGQGFDRVMLAQPYHPGRDERVIVVGSTAVAAYQRMADGDWRANVAVGARVAATPVTSELEDLCQAVTGVTGTEIYALDLFVDGAGRRVINEVNHVPLFKGAAQATGTDICAAVLDYLAGLSVCSRQKVGAG